MTGDGTLVYSARRQHSAGTAAVLGTLVVLVASSGCNAPHGAPASPTPTEACTPASPSASAPSLRLCLGGALTGAVTTADNTSVCSRLTDEGFDVAFFSTLDGTRTTLQLSDQRGAGTFGASDPALTIDVSQPSGPKNWSSAVSPASGTVVIAPDRSGLVDLTLPERDYATGAKLDGPALTVRGSFRCPASTDQTDR